MKRFTLKRFTLPCLRDVNTEKGSVLRHDNLPPECHYTPELRSTLAKKTIRPVPFLDFFKQIRVVTPSARRRLATLGKVRLRLPT